MREFEGTQGVWKVKNNGFLTDVVSGDITIATFLNKDGLSAAEANAQLTATAPDLLKALQGLLTVIDDSEGVHGYHLNGDLAFWEEFKEVEDAEIAVKKALGINK